jgi:nucleotide-binding universal stress UspA family protein
MKSLTDTQGPAKNIAVLTDFSPCSSSALNHAIRMATFFNGKVFLIHAIEPWSYAYFDGGTETEQQLCDRARWNMLREEEKLRDVRHEVIVEQGRPWDVLGRLLALNRIDLITLGTIGTVGFHNDEVIGSTAQQVIRQVPCPVLSVGSEVAVRDSFPKIGQILFPTDLSDGARSAASYAASMAERQRAHLVLMHVLPNHRPAESGEAEWLKEPYLRRLGDVVRRSPALSYPPDCLVEFSESPANAILKAARELPVDLIVMGRVRRDKAGTNGRVHNSLRILVQAPCPVLTIPEKNGFDIGNNVCSGQDDFYVGQPEGLGPSACAL